MSFKDFLYESTLTEQELHEMARVTPAHSGITSIMIYASEKEVVHGRHGARIKVSNVPNTFDGHDCFVVILDKTTPTITGTPKLKSSTVDDILDWTVQNYEVLISYWTGLPVKLADGTLAGPFPDKESFLLKLTPLH